MRIRVIGASDACVLEEAACDLAEYLVRTVRAAAREGKSVGEIVFSFKYVDKNLVRVQAKYCLVGTGQGSPAKHSGEDDFDDHLIPEGMKEIEHLQFLAHRLGQLALAHGLGLDKETGSSFSLTPLE